MHEPSDNVVKIAGIVVGAVLFAVFFVMVFARDCPSPAELVN